jgi:hypothetical protein
MGFWKEYLSYLSIWEGIGPSRWYNVYLLDLCSEEMSLERSSHLVPSKICVLYNTK